MAIYELLMYVILATDIADFTNISMSATPSIVIAGEQVTLTCVAFFQQGTTQCPSATAYAWSGQRLESDTVHDHNIFMLTSTHLSDAGQNYTCEAFCGSYTISTGVNIHLKSKKKFNLFLNEIIPLFSSTTKCDH